MILTGLVVLALMPSAAMRAEESGVIVVVEKVPMFELSQEEQEVIDLTNAQRARAGLPALAMNPQLMSAAREHANAMAAWGRLSHTLNGKTFTHRAADAGYMGAVQSENIAWNQNSPSDVLQTWLNSRGHRANIFSGCNEIGVAMMMGPRGDRYWVQVFGVR
jgi:uncharacterized protein YkwD